LALSPGEVHDVRLAGKLLSGMKPGSVLLADRGYDADWIRELAMKRARGPTSPRKAIAAIRSASARTFIALATKSNGFSTGSNNVVVATRYDRLAGNYLAFVQLAAIRLWLAARYEAAP
jgi:transposase